MKNLKITAGMVLLAITVAFGQHEKENAFLLSQEKGKDL